jgi:AcrR family transcriptional regulator
MSDAADPTRTQFEHLFGNVQIAGGVFRNRGVAMAVREDRRVQRTRELLRQALVALIREKGFEDLSVQEIIDRANVGRATFYAHFDNKEDLLLSGFDTLRASLKDQQRQASRKGRLEERVLAFSRELFAHVNDHRGLYQAMAGKHSGAVIQSVVHKLLLELVREDLKAVFPRGHSKAARTEALAQFIAGGMFGLLMWWLAGGTRASADELNASFQRFALAVLKTESS